ncbi:serine protease EDA2, partial [Tolypocladium capitatum]
THYAQARHRQLASRKASKGDWRDNFPAVGTQSLEKGQGRAFPWPLCFNEPRRLLFCPRPCLVVLTPCLLGLFIVGRATMFRDGEPTRGDAEARRGDKTGSDESRGERMEPSVKMTRHQAFYIFVLDGLGGMALSGGVNFAIAYGAMAVMYTTQDTAKHPIRLFQLPNTLAGDAAVTIVVQCILTWFVEMGLVAHDLAQRSVQPIGCIDEPAHPWLRRLFFLPPGRETAIRRLRAASFGSVMQQALRGFALSVPAFLALWPAAVGILTAVGRRRGGDYVYSDRWTPQVFKLVLGGLLGLLTTPLMAVFWLVRAGWEAKHTSGAEGRRVEVKLILATSAFHPFPWTSPRPRLLLPPGGIRILRHPGGAMAFKGLATCAAAALLTGQAAALHPWGPWLGFQSSDAVGAARGGVLAAARPADSAAIEAHNLSVPVDHFHNESRYEPHSHDFFDLRYWLDATHYREGGPVIVLHSGEFPGEGRLPFLEHGIVPMLTKATGGLGLVLEHRYYGTSYPVPDTTVENLRFLTTEQALADAAYFARHVRFPGLEHLDLTAPGTPYIIYGGSYAGAFAALTRKLYPDVYWGAISSSGVTAAVDEYWQYFEAARHFAPGDCSPTLQRLTRIIDGMLFADDPAKADEIKDLFGLKELYHDEFASVLSGGISGLQNTNWDPEEDFAEYGTYCATIASDALLFASTAHLRPAVRRIVSFAGYDAEGQSLTARMLNYVGHVRNRVRRDKRYCRGSSLRECFSARFAEHRTDLAAGWQRSWLYQTCTQWGYFVTGEGVPRDRLPMVSRALTYDYATIRCRSQLNITAPPDVDSINRLGGLNFSYPRLALIDGAQDPWRAASPHAMGLPDRESTTEEPFMLIDWGVHHWDENGLKDEVEGLPPKQVVEAQRKEVEFVQAWLQEFERERKRGSAEQMTEELRRAVQGPR